MGEKCSRFLLEKGLTPSQVADRFVNEINDSLIQLKEKIDKKIMKL